MTWRHLLVPMCVGLAACPRSFDDDFCCFDTAVPRDFRDTGRDSGGGNGGTCVPAVLDFTPGTTMLEANSRPWILFARGATPTFTVRDPGGGSIPRELRLRSSDVGTVYQVAFTDEQTLGEVEVVATWSDTVDIRDPDNPSTVLERVQFCDASISLTWVSSLAPPTVSPDVAAPSWLRAGGDDADALLLTRLLDKGSTTGRALRLDPSGSDLRLTTVRRDPGLPADGCDPADTLTLMGTGETYTASAETWTLDSDMAPLVLHDVALTASFRGDGTASLDLDARADLSGWPAALRTATCDGAVAFAARTCAPCTPGGPPACFDLSMVGVRTEPLPQTAGTDTTACGG